MGRIRHMGRTSSSGQPCSSQQEAPASGVPTDWPPVTLGTCIEHVCVCMRSAGTGIGERPATFHPSSRDNKCSGDSWCGDRPPQQ
ncbi:hypothetical protein O3P69_012217 [Scylla paramamosain]|uniref:Uncharacterized protein n=1 Tax=Scylla paramamosain TaxID=85552 RepID=A0AAW0TD26_SCYPA